MAGVKCLSLQLFLYSNFVIWIQKFEPPPLTSRSAQFFSRLTPVNPWLLIKRRLTLKIFPFNKLRPIIWNYLKLKKTLKNRCLWSDIRAADIMWNIADILDSLLLILPSLRSSIILLFCVISQVLTLLPSIIMQH